ncbi:hypothetical protein [Marinisporobacter balticus]|uniref:Uncharacterized protein n=1 Tax=Marinisporobacter balticus TaxID=2018667 RepID=A0A4R2L0T8_9FIRM|nr:hypothetical protein [Marinisporobacter balticus]TCO77409.1 hypothetical protein EV214_10651 [Marinisporobacter balticus]
MYGSRAFLAMYENIMASLITNFSCCGIILVLFVTRNVKLPDFIVHNKTDRGG